MGIIGSVGSFYQPWKNRGDEQTPIRGDFFQTMATAKATAGVLKVIGSATTAGEYWITSLHIAVQTATAASFTLVSVSGTNSSYIIGSTDTGTCDTLSFNFGPIGLQCGGIAGTTTSTNTLDLIISAGQTATIGFVCTGYKIV